MPGRINSSFSRASSCSIALSRGSLAAAASCTPEGLCEYAAHGTGNRAPVLNAQSSSEPAMKLRLEEWFRECVEWNKRVKWVKSITVHQLSPHRLHRSHCPAAEAAQ